MKVPIVKGKRCPADRCFPSFAEDAVEELAFFHCLMEVTSNFPSPGLSSVPGWAARLPAWARKLTGNNAGQEFLAGSAGLASCPELRGPRSQLCRVYTTGLLPSRGIAGPCTASSRQLCLVLGLFCRAGHAGTSLCIWDLGCVRRQSLEIIHIYDQVLPARARLTGWYEQALTD